MDPNTHDPKNKINNGIPKIGTYSAFNHGASSLMSKRYFSPTKLPGHVIIENV